MNVLELCHQITQISHNGNERISVCVRAYICVCVCLAILRESMINIFLSIDIGYIYTEIYKSVFTSKGFLGLFEYNLR